MGHFFCIAAAVLAIETGSPTISLEVAFEGDGTATPLWTRGISTGIGDEKARALQDEIMPLSPGAAAWLQVLEDSIPGIEKRAGELVRLLDVPALDAIVVAGDRGSSDGFGWVPNYAGINVQAMADTYGPPGDGAMDRMIRITAHEYLHLLSYAHYPNHRELRQTPLDRALWTVWFEGIGDYVSISKRWLPDDSGRDSAISAATLARLEPVMVDRLERFVAAGPERERELRANIAMGRFTDKWGSLPFALWLHREVRQCGEAATLRAVLRLERDGVLPLALRHASPELKHRLMALQDEVGRPPVGAGNASACLADMLP